MILGSIPLDRATRIVIVQFSFKNERSAPLNIRKMPHETPSERKQRTSRDSKTSPVFRPAERTDIQILNGLEDTGYQLVDAFWKPCIDPKDGGTHQMVRFLFSNTLEEREEKSEIGSETNRSAIERMCFLSLWRVRAFINPYFRNRQAVEGLKTISINLELREPRFNPDGSPFVRWTRDASGNKTGTEPDPVRSLHRLYVSSGEIILETAALRN